MSGHTKQASRLRSLETLGERIPEIPGAFVKKSGKFSLVAHFVAEINAEAELSSYFEDNPFVDIRSLGDLDSTQRIQGIARRIYTAQRNPNGDVRLLDVARMVESKHASLMTHTFPNYNRADVVGLGGQPSVVDYLKGIAFRNNGLCRPDQSVPFEVVATGLSNPLQAMVPTLEHEILHDPYR